MTSAPATTPASPQSRACGRQRATREFAFNSASKRRRAGQAFLDPFGNRKAGKRRAADGLDFWGRRFGRIPPEESAKKVRISLDLLHVFSGVARSQQFQREDCAAGIKRDQNLIRTG